MLTVLQRQHAVVAQPRGTAPDDDIAVRERHPARLFRATCTAKEKYRGQSERDGHDRRLQVALIAILMQRQTRSGLVAVDETRIGREAAKARRGGGGARELPKCR